MPDVPTIDVHHHAIPAGLIETVRAEGARFGASIQSGADRSEWLVLPDGSRTQLRQPLTDETLRRVEMSEAEIDIGLESILPTSLFYRGAEAGAEWLARSINDAIAANARASSGHVMGMAHVPLQFPAMAVRELERVVNEHGMRSVQVGSNVRNENLDQPDFFPFWEAAEALNVLVFVHPHDQAAEDRLRRYYLRNLIGNPLDTSIAVASIIFGGVLDRFPRLKLCFAHAGGYAPWIRGRWRHGQEVRPESKERGANRPFDEYFGQLYFDTVIHDERALSYLIDSVGAGRVLHGTDYPADMGSITQVPLIRRLPGLTQEQKADILGGNALRLIGVAG